MLSLSFKSHCEFSKQAKTRQIIHPQAQTKNSRPHIMSLCCCFNEKTLTVYKAIHFHMQENSFPQQLVGENSPNNSQALECFNFPLGLLLGRMCVSGCALGHKELIRGPNGREAIRPDATLHDPLRALACAEGCESKRSVPPLCASALSLSRSDFNLA